MRFSRNSVLTGVLTAERVIQGQKLWAGRGLQRGLPKQRREPGGERMGHFGGNCK